MGTMILWARCVTSSGVPGCRKVSGPGRLKFDTFSADVLDLTERAQLGLWHRERMLGGWKAALSHLGHVLGESLLCDGTDGRVPRGELRLEAVVQAEEVVDHLHLPARVHTGTDPDRRHRKAARDQGGHLGGDALEHDREAARVLEGARVGEQLSRGVRRLALDAVAAERCVRLRREPHVPHHRDARIDERRDLRQHAPTALELDRVRARLLEQPRAVCESVVHGEV
mmetsp:Transcript_19557/g.50508  ORF Transcript_19557/g.50508 Transcript_19557/m.50508 type:complete len:227 (-) Transcript_19557:668-1348(-)